MTDVEELPTIKDKIFFADDFNQACKMLDNDPSYATNDALSGQLEDLNKLMFFGVEGWTDKKNKGKLANSMKNFDLEQMELFGCELGAEGTKELASGMKNAITNPNFKLQKLELDHSPLKGSEAVKTIFESLGNKCELLNLQGSVEDGDVLAALLNGLANNTTVTKLDLKINKLKGDDFKPFEDFFKQNTTMKDLELFYNEVGQGALYLAKGLMSDTCVLERLNLSCNNLGSEGLFKFTRCIGITKHLKVLDISLNNIGDDAMLPFLTLAAGVELVPVPGEEQIYKPTYTVEVQGWFQKIYEGKIEGNVENDIKPDDPKSEEQYKAIMDHMGNFDIRGFSLEWLDISANNLTDVATAGIAMVINKNHDLEHFDFTGIEATSAGWENIRVACEANIDYQNQVKANSNLDPEEKEKILTKLKNQCVSFSVVDIPEEKLEEFDSLLKDHDRFYYKRRNEKAAEQKA